MKKFILPAIVALVVAMSCSNDKKPAGDEKKDNGMMMNENKLERNKKVVMASIQSFEKGDID